MAKYSVIIPTHGGKERLPIVLNSLVRQSIPKTLFEVVIINDGDSVLANSLQKIASGYPELYIRTFSLSYNFGPAVARNRGIAAASGEIYFFTDDDCELPALWMETHISLYERHPDISMIGGWYKPLRKHLYRNLFLALVHLRYEGFFPDLYRTVRSDKTFPSLFPAKNTANLSIRKSVARKILFNERFVVPGFEDSNFSERIIEAGFIGLYIPLFVIHHKRMGASGFMKLSLNRGLGRFVSMLIDPKFISTTQLCCGQPMRYISRLSEVNTYIRNNRLILNILAFTYCFISNSSLFSPFHRFRYARHQSKLERLYRFESQARESI